MKDRAQSRMRSRLLAVVAIAVSPVLHAQDDAPTFADDVLQGTRLRAALESGVSYTDNFFYARNTGNESGSGLLVRPELMVTHVVPRFRFFGGADAEFAWFDLPRNVDDYIDHQYKLGAEWQPASRHQYTFVSDLRLAHDPFGTERTEDGALEDRDIDQWRRTRTNVTYRYGLPDDRYTLEIRAGGFNKEYTNNRDVTQFLDHEVVSGQIFGFYNLGSRTSVYATAGAQRSYYEEIAPGAFDRGANTLRYLLGTRWLATAKTSGDIAVGYVTRDPIDGDRDRFNRVDWLAGITWAPRTVREFRLTTGRRAQESYLNTVDFIDNRYVGLEWSEQWAARLRTQLSATYLKSDFIGTDRLDDSARYALSGEYLVTPKLKLLGQVSHGQRDSDADFANYDRFYAYIGARYAR